MDMMGYNGPPDKMETLRREVKIDYCWHCATDDVPCYQYTNDEGIPEAVCKQCLLRFVARIDDYCEGRR